MREIKFRGIRIDNGEWVHGCYHKSDYSKDGDHTIVRYDTIMKYNEPFFVNPSTVGQFTGFKDKNGKGKDIYENDLSEDGIVIFSDGKWVMGYPNYPVDLYDWVRDDPTREVTTAQC